MLRRCPQVLKETGLQSHPPARLSLCICIGVQVSLCQRSGLAFHIGFTWERTPGKGLRGSQPEDRFKSIFETS